MVRDDKESRVAGIGDFGQQIAKTLDIGVVERRVDFVQDTDRCGIGQEHAEQQGNCGQRLFATGQERHDLQLLARWAGHDFQAGFKRVVGLGQGQIGPPAAEQFYEQFLEMVVDRFEGRHQSFPAFAVELANALAQAGYRGDQVIAFALHRIDLGFQFLRLDFGAQVDRAHIVPLANLPHHLCLDGFRIRQFFVFGDIGFP